MRKRSNMAFYGLHKLNEYQVGNKRFLGEIIGINLEGKLVLKIDGDNTIFNHGEITFL